nr:Uncharacterised protein [Klebsiella pneumoniae]
MMSQLLTLYTTPVVYLSLTVCGCVFASLLSTGKRIT